MDTTIRFENANDDFIAAITSMAKVANVKATIESDWVINETTDRAIRECESGKGCEVVANYDDFHKQMLQCN